MAANNQFKINQLAKDMGIKGKELSEFIARSAKVVQDAYLK